MQCNYNSFIQIINFHALGFSVMLCGAEKMVPAEYWCPYNGIHVHVYCCERLLNMKLN